MHHIHVLFDTTRNRWFAHAQLNATATPPITRQAWQRFGARGGHRHAAAVLQWFTNHPHEALELETLQDLARDAMQDPQTPLNRAGIQRLIACINAAGEQAVQQVATYLGTSGADWLWLCSKNGSGNLTLEWSPKVKVHSPQSTVYSPQSTAARIFARLFDAQSLRLGCTPSATQPPS